MNKISTRDLSSMPNIEELRNLCKSLAVLDAIICPEWENRYYSYISNWNDNEEFFEMRDGSGDEMKILFCLNGCVINGFSHESELCDWNEVEVEEKISFIEKWFGNKKNKTELIQNIPEGVLDSLPNEFHHFIFEEPVKNSGTTFCIWRKPYDSKWHVGDIEYSEDEDLDGSLDLLYIFDGNPGTYKSWAEEYFEEMFLDRELELDLIESIYNGELITKELVMKINPERSDLTQLKLDLTQIGYRFDI